MENEPKISKKLVITITVVSIVIGLLGVGLFWWLGGNSGTGGKEAFATVDGEEVYVEDYEAILKVFKETDILDNEAVYPYALIPEDNRESSYNSSTEINGLVQTLDIPAYIDDEILGNLINKVYALPGEGQENYIDCMNECKAYDAADYAGTDCQTVCASKIPESEPPSDPGPALSPSCLEECNNYNRREGSQGGEVRDCGTECQIEDPNNSSESSEWADPNDNSKNYEDCMNFCKAGKDGQGKPRADREDGGEAICHEICKDVPPDSECKVTDVLDGDPGGEGELADNADQGEGVGPEGPPAPPSPSEEAIKQMAKDQALDSVLQNKEAKNKNVEASEKEISDMINKLRNVATDDDVKDVVDKMMKEAEKKGVKASEENMNDVIDQLMKEAEKRGVGLSKENLENMMDELIKEKAGAGGKEGGGGGGSESGEKGLGISAEKLNEMMDNMMGGMYGNTTQSFQSLDPETQEGYRLIAESEIIKNKLKRITTTEKDGYISDCPFSSDDYAKFDLDAFLKNGGGSSPSQKDIALAYCKEASEKLEAREKNYESEVSRAIEKATGKKHGDQVTAGIDNDSTNKYVRFFRFIYDKDDPSTYSIEAPKKIDLGDTNTNSYDVTVISDDYGYTEGVLEYGKAKEHVMSDAEYEKWLDSLYKKYDVQIFPEKIN